MDYLRRTRQAPNRCRDPATRLTRPLHLDLGEQRGQIEVASDPFSIGSTADNELTLEDPYVSRRHCELRTRNGQLWIQDLGSRNGTWVNDVRVEHSQLRLGSRLELGRTALRLSDSKVSDDSGLLGNHPSMKRVLRKIERFAQSAAPILLLGETGTGKELAARAIHNASGLRGRLEVLNCGAIPHQLAESELFGHERGAFTGAASAYEGAFRRADSGTLFLDEIGEMPLDIQAKLLRTLEDGRVRPVGGSHTHCVLVRIISATHRNLERDAVDGRFRLDLFHRLAVGVIRLPPLRERIEDIPLLTQHFLHQLQAAHAPGSTDSAAHDSPRIAADVMPYLQQQRWPGNVRQLRHALHAARHQQRITNPMHGFRDRWRWAADRPARGLGYPR